MLIGMTLIETPAVHVHLDCGRQKHDDDEVRFARPPHSREPPHLRRQYPRRNCRASVAIAVPIPDLTPRLPTNRSTTGDNSSGRLLAWLNLNGCEKNVGNNRVIPFRYE